MIEIQRNKRFGLMKLKKIAGAPNPNWFVSPHVTLTTNQKLTPKKINGSTRLLARSDEIGRNYRKYEYASMPRKDLPVIEINPNEKSSPELVPLINQLKKYRPKSVLVIHPTRPRGDIRWTGSIQIANITKGATPVLVSAT